MLAMWYDACVSIIVVGHVVGVAIVEETVVGRGAFFDAAFVVLDVVELFI